jgi:hypothetical protein
MEVERFFDYMSIHEDRKVKLVAYKFKGGASAWWDILQITDFPSPTREGTCDFMVEDEAATQSMVFTIGF